MGKKEHERVLDYVLVPAGVLFFLGYHLYLFHRVGSKPLTTVIGRNDRSRSRWVKSVISAQGKKGTLSAHILRNNIMASTVLASTSITLCSLIAILLNYASSDKESYAAIIYGDDGHVVSSVKYFCILICFLAAFLCNVESIRYYSHASFLINVPLEVDDNVDGTISVDYVVMTVNRASYWWSLGLKAFYLSFPLFLWVFGPIPMFVCSLSMVVLLYFIDRVPEDITRKKAQIP